MLRIVRPVAEAVWLVLTIQFISSRHQLADSRLLPPKITPIRLLSLKGIEALLSALSIPFSKISVTSFSSTSSTIGSLTSSAAASLAGGTGGVGIGDSALFSEIMLRTKGSLELKITSSLTTFIFTESGVTKGINLASTLLAASENIARSDRTL